MISFRPKAGAGALAPKLLLLAAALLAALAAAEVGLRLAGPRARHINDSGRYYTNPRGYYEQVGVDGAQILYGLHYNTTKEGFRLPDGTAGWAAPRAAGQAEVLLLGDSFTFGRGVRYGDTYGARLEKLLAAGGSSWRVRNAGAVGLNAEEIARVYRHEAAGQKYKLVVYGFVLNDFGLELRGPGGSDLIDQNNAAPGQRGFSAVLDLVRGAIAARRLTRATIKAYQASFNGDQAREKYALLRRLDAEVKAGGGQLVIMVFPLLYNFKAYPFTGIHAGLLSFCAAEKINCLDLLPVFSKYPESRLWAAPTDQHPNETAHRLAAEALAEFLYANSLVPARRL